ncbi:MAG TPA: SAM-dependent methyltransferase [Pseudonocardiaceae bacterium]|jgi:O-methyltransferase involved in polyketide biosynthesis|nr:SAM-dependent methyltransferase [Pseudonocardiaceae bacterium]
MAAPPGGQRAGREVTAPVAIDPTTANIARVHDAALGGRDNYAVDRQALAELLSAAPQTALAIRSVRRWLVRVTRFLAQQGVDQFLDCGAGLPTMDNTHQVAQRHNPDATVVYLDIDRATTEYGQALLAGRDRTFYLHADLTRPAEVLATPAVAARLDRSRPIALIQCGSLPYLDDSAQPAEVLAEYVDALPAGSFVALAHWWDPADGAGGSALARATEQAYQDGSLGAGRFRTRAEISALFGGLHILEPGLVEIDQWWPEGPSATPPTLAERLVLGALARKN